MPIFHMVCGREIHSELSKICDEYRSPHGLKMAIALRSFPSGGGHWMLCVNITNTTFVYDSAHYPGDAQCFETAHSVFPHSEEVVAVPITLQTPFSVDCGYYALSVAKLLMERFNLCASFSKHDRAAALRELKKQALVPIPPDAFAHVRANFLLSS